MRVRHTFRTILPTTAVAAACALSLLAGPASAAEQRQAPAPQPPAEVAVKVGDRPVTTLLTRAVHPLGVLERADIKLTPYDRVLLVRHGHVVVHDAYRDVREGDTVRLVRIDVDVTAHRTAIKRGTVVRKTTKLAPGRRKVVAPGRPGVREVRVRHWTRNGEPLRVDSVRSVVREPQPRRVLLGVRARTVPGTGHLNWAALARCESGGNPHAVNPAGYYGLYQFSIGTWHGVGGQGIPSQASPAEQTYRAQILYSRSGRSPWPYCGRFL